MKKLALLLTVATLAITSCNEQKADEAATAVVDSAATMATDAATAVVDSAATAATAVIDSAAAKVEEVKK